jgi:hypothetical protein
VTGQEPPDVGTDPRPALTDSGPAPATSALEDLMRWQHSGGLWRVVARTSASLEIALLTCSGAEEMARLVSTDPELLEFVGERRSSQHDPANGAAGIKRPD